MRLPTTLLVLALAFPTLHPGGEGVAQEPSTHDLPWDLTRPQGSLSLPDAVFEASGLTFTSDGGRLLVHGDEAGVVVSVDPAAGRVSGAFTVGRPRVENDLEGIASVGPRLFLVASTGLLYEFREPEPGAASPVRLTDTGLGRGCEVEGLEYDAAAGDLLLACKTVSPKGDDALIHRVPLVPGAARPSPVRIPLAQLADFGLRRRLHPSAIAVDPARGTLLLLAAREGLLVEVARTGRILAVAHLSRRRHPQPEGLAVGADGRLWIADEGQGRKGARLTWYAPRARAGAGEGTP